MTLIPDVVSRCGIRNSEAGMLWAWEGSLLRNKLGNYLTVAGYSGSSGAQVVFWTNVGEMGRKWKKVGDRLQSGKGYFLSTDGNGGKGTDTCVWSKNDEAGKLWKFVEG